MSSFKWIDRDTAARDMLQLVYHAPPLIAHQALIAIKTIRSTAIADELLQIILDTSYSSDYRHHAVQAFANIPGDMYVPQLQPILEQELTAPDEQSLDSYAVNLSGIADKHPSNRQWYFDTLEKAEPKIYYDHLTHLLIYHISNEFEQLLINRLMRLMEKQPDLMELDGVAAIFDDGNQDQHQWLEEHIESIFQRYFVESKPQHIRSFMTEWKTLHKRIESDLPELAEQINEQEEKWRKYREERWKVPDFRNTRSWQNMSQLHADGLDGNKRAVHQLYGILREDELPLPIRATAVYFLKDFLFVEEYEYLIEIFVRHFLYEQDDWEHEDHIFNPLRYELGESLYHSASPDAWEAMLTVMLTKPFNEGYLDDWLEHLTDLLSGIHTPYGGVRRDVNYRAWFHALVELEEDQRVQAMNRRL